MKEETVKNGGFLQIKKVQKLKSEFFKIGIARTPSPAIGKNLISVGSVDNEQRYSQVIQDEQSEGVYGK